LEEALIKASEKNANVLVQGLDIDINRLEVSKKKKTFLPGVTFSVEEDLMKDDTWDPQGVGPEKIAMSLPIYTGGKLTGSLDNSKFAYDISLLENVSVKLEARSDVIDAYFTIMNLKKQVEVADEVVQTLEKQKKRLERLYDNGRLVPKGDILKLESDIVTNKALKMRRENEIMIAKDNFKVLIGMPINDELELKDFDVESLDIEKYDPNTDSEKALAEGSRANMEKLYLAQAENSIKLAKANYYPNVYMDTEYRVKKDEDENDDWVVTLKAKWDVFKWGSNKDNLEQRKREKEQAEIKYKESLDRIAIDIRSKYIEMLTLKDELASQELKLDIARENSRIDTLRYTNGMVSSLDYLDSVNKLQQAEEKYYALQRNFVFAVDEYESSLK
jgi:outer membrane protein TolC